MNCPLCGAPMKRGHITGQSILRVVPDEGNCKSTHHYTQEDLADFRAAELPGWLLDVPYAGMAPCIQADYCLDCGKVFCQMDILKMQKEE